MSNRSKKDVNRIVACMPRWFERLVAGDTVFGSRRDKLVLEIIRMGGIKHLQREGKLKISQDAEPTLVMSYQQLSRLKTSLEKREKEAKIYISDLSKSSIGNLQVSGGAISFTLRTRRGRK